MNKNKQKKLKVIDSLGIITMILSLTAISFSTKVNASSLLKVTQEAQTVKNNNNITLYGSRQKANMIGAEYLLFQRENKDSVKGLVYVQNSDVFSCFNANYDRQNEFFEKIVFAYPEMSSDKWITDEDEQKMSLDKFPHQLDYVDINENTQQLFNQCLDYFEQS